MTEPISIIPIPLDVRELGGPAFRLTPDVVFATDADPVELSLGVLGAGLIGGMLGAPIEVRSVDDGGPGIIALRLDPQAGPAEADPAERYRLLVTAERVDLTAPTGAGLMRGLSTLRQLLQPGPGDVRVAPAVDIHDAPRYPWRGLSVDIARHFFGLDHLKLVVMVMAHYKLNVLHLHLTDDQGWRLHLPSLPRLTERSSGTAVGGGPGGFLTADDYRDLVAFAAARHVTVVPEIDVPGHVNAALHAYGELTPSGEPAEVYTGIEVGFSRLHAELPATAPFLRDVFTDLARLTPGPFLHLGGDEVLTMEPAEYARLVTLASDAIRAAGKRVIGWQEIANVPLEPGTVVQYWDTRVDPAPFVAAAQAGARMLLSPGSKTYLDMKYHEDYELGLEWAGHIELRDAYEWEPSTLIPGLPPESIVGVEAAVWTETLETFEQLMTMLLPRLLAVAEVAWSVPARRDFASFRDRLPAHVPVWDRWGFGWYPSPQVDWLAPR